MCMSVGQAAYQFNPEERGSKSASSFGQWGTRPSEKSGQPRANL
jgi:hypothetical protein